MNPGVVILPVKEPGAAKLRLAPLLHPPERAALWWAMFEDVSAALARTGIAVVVVTNSDRASARARRLGWRVFRERAQVSESASVDAACRQVSREGCPRALRIPADVPLVRPEDIATIAEMPASAGSTVLVPSRDGSGTNAILRSPPDLFPSRFGTHSLVLHTQEALRAGSTPAILENERLALDLDDARDVHVFLQRPSDTRTYALLSTFGLAERIAVLG